MRRESWNNTRSPIFVAGPYKLSRAKPCLKPIFDQNAQIGTSDHGKVFFRAKYGKNVDAALEVVNATLNELYLTRIKIYLEALEKQGISKPILVAPERETGQNALASIAAKQLASRLGLEFDDNIVQLPSQTRKGLSKISKLFEFPGFDGSVAKGRYYIAVDDMIGTGATIAELRSYIIRNGGQYAFGCALASSSGTDHLINSSEDQKSAILNNLGQTMTEWFERTTDVAIDTLTRVESFILAGEKARALIPEMAQKG